MSGFHSARTRVQASVYARLGDDATWNGAPVIVRIADPEAVVSFQQTDVILPSVLIKVPKSQMATPAAGDMIVMTESGDTYRVLADPVLNKRHEWVCQAEKV